MRGFQKYSLFLRELIRLLRHIPAMQILLLFHQRPDPRLYYTETKLYCLTASSLCPKHMLPRKVPLSRLTTNIEYLSRLRKLPTRYLLNTLSLPVPLLSSRLSLRLPKEEWLLPLPGLNRPLRMSVLLFHSRAVLCALLPVLSGLILLSRWYTKVRYWSKNW